MCCGLHRDGVSPRLWCPRYLYIKVNGEGEKVNERHHIQGWLGELMMVVHTPLLARNASATNKMWRAFSGAQAQMVFWCGCWVRRRRNEEK